MNTKPVDQDPDELKPEGIFQMDNREWDTVMTLGKRVGNGDTSEFHT